MTPDHRPYPWQQKLWQQIISQQLDKRLPHALLLHAVSGLGKVHFARCLAQYLLCNSPVDRVACGCCNACRQVQAGSHPDLVWLAPQTAGKAIIIDQIRALGDFFSYTSQRVGWKIAIVEQAEKMNQNAANSLLKTLEEPPLGSLILLLTAWPMLLPATLRSRCQALFLRRPDKHQLINWLTEQISGESDVAAVELAWLRAQGSPLLALHYSSAEQLAKRRRYWAIFQQLCQGQVNVIQAVEQWQKEDDDKHIGMRFLLSWYNDLIKLKTVPGVKYLVNPDLQHELSNIAAGITIGRLYQQLDKLYEIYRLYAATQVNPQLLLEDLFLTITDFDPAGEINNGRC